MQQASVVEKNVTEHMEIGEKRTEKLITEAPLIINGSLG